MRALSHGLTRFLKVELQDLPIKMEKAGWLIRDTNFQALSCSTISGVVTGGWMFPSTVTERMAPYATSGGAIGPDGLLYVMGHDRPEMYVLGKPKIGPTLLHIATIRIDAEGQAFSWSSTGQRIVAVIDRRLGRVRMIEIPIVEHAQESISYCFLIWR